MQAILMGVAICLFGVAVTVLLVAVAFRQEQEEGGENAAGSEPTKRHSITAEQFFIGERSDPDLESGTPVDPLFLKLQRHVQMESEAAETFLRMPSVESLHAPSTSPLWN